MESIVTACLPIKGQQRHAFTLIELLIVVAIIAMLAAIAVPNFLAAQTRAKVSRTRADLRSLATGLEAYAADANAYPPNPPGDLFSAIPLELSTPVAYLASARWIDPFSDHELHPVHGELARFYTYNRIVSYEEFELEVAAGREAPPEAIDHLLFNDGALEKYGGWRLVGNGPDRVYSDGARFAHDFPLWGADIAYDPSNGALSWGNILRTEQRADGAYAR